MSAHDKPRALIADRRRTFCRPPLCESCVDDEELLAGYEAALDEIDRITRERDLGNRMLSEAGPFQARQAERIAELTAGLREALAMVTLSPDLEEQHDRLHGLLPSEET